MPLGPVNGRALFGSRTVFSQGFLKDLAEVSSEEGREFMASDLPLRLKQLGH